MGLAVEHPRCPYCHQGVAPREPKVACDGCMGWHHRGCWSEHGRCAACGGEAALEPPERSPPAALELAAGTVCPRCARDLHADDASGVPVRACDGCQATWLTEGACRAALAATALEPEVLRRALEQVFSGPRRAVDPLACPACRAPLAVVRVQGELAVRRCAGHGLWLEARDLERLQALAASHAALVEPFLGSLATPPPLSRPGGIQ